MRALSLFIRWTDEVGVAEAARVLGCHKSFVSHVRAGRKRLGLQTAARLERHTAETWKSHGPIKATDWAAAA